MELVDAQRSRGDQEDVTERGAKFAPTERAGSTRLDIDLTGERLPGDPSDPDAADRVTAPPEVRDDVVASPDQAFHVIVELLELVEELRLAGADLLEDTAGCTTPSRAEDERVEVHAGMLPAGSDTHPLIASPLSPALATCRSLSLCDNLRLRAYAPRGEAWTSRVDRNRIPGMRNAVPDLADELAERALADRQASYADEVRRLLEAGFAVMGRTENLDPRVSDIVRSSGLSNQTFYRHFRGKDEFFLALLEDGRRRLVETIDRRMRRATDDAGRVRAWIEAVFAQAQDPQAAAATRPFALNGERLAARFPDAAQRSQARLVAPLQAVVGDADAQAIYHLVMGSMNDALATRRVPGAAEVAHIVDFALKGVNRGT